jgi:hypothetical protein
VKERKKRDFPGVLSHLCHDGLWERGVFEGGEWFGVRDGMCQLVEGEMRRICSSGTEDGHIFPVSPSSGSRNIFYPINTR